MGFEFKILVLQRWKFFKREHEEWKRQQGPAQAVCFHSYTDVMLGCSQWKKETPTKQLFSTGAKHSTA